ncbi:hypothetical protein VZT92_003648 [Zoarces viviparus]|uniref:Uncharacterized protein n=1 Tax=Zoarces viviparus TaxID=48416 RepID=A0AAW1FVD2_ZOAVI
MKLSRSPPTGVQTGTRVTDTVPRGTLLSTPHNAQNPASKGPFPSLSPAQTTIPPTAKQPTSLSTNTLALLLTLSPIWPLLPQWPLPNFLDLLRCHQEGECVLTKSMPPTGRQDWRPGRP